MSAPRGVCRGATRGRRAPTPVSSIRCGGQVSRVPKPPRCSSTAAAGTAAGVALEAGAVANQGEVAAFAATLALVAFDPRFGGPFDGKMRFAGAAERRAGAADARLGAQRQLIVDLLGELGDRQLAVAQRLRRRRHARRQLLL